MCNLPYVIYLDSMISGFSTYHYLHDICIVETFTHIVVFLKLDTTFRISDFQFRRTINLNHIYKFDMFLSWPIMIKSAGCDFGRFIFCSEKEY